MLKLSIQLRLCLNVAWFIIGATVIVVYGFAYW